MSRCFYTEFCQNFAITALHPLSSLSASRWHVRASVASIVASTDPSRNTVKATLSRLVSNGPRSATVPDVPCMIPSADSARPDSENILSSSLSAFQRFFHKSSPGALPNRRMPRYIRITARREA
jgi:hypothetical protein